jgi:hypothetical protein
MSCNYISLRYLVVACHSFRLSHLFMRAVDNEAVLICWEQSNRQQISSTQIFTQMEQLVVSDISPTRGSHSQIHKGCILFPLASYWKWKRNVVNFPFSFSQWSNWDNFMVILTTSNLVPFLPWLILAGALNQSRFSFHSTSSKLGSICTLFHHHIWMWMWYWSHFSDAM